MKRLFFLILLLAPFEVLAEVPVEPGTEQEPSVTWLASTTPPTARSAKSTRIDRIHRQSEEMVQRLIGKVDSFFVTEDYATFRDNETRVRLRLDADHYENAGWDLSPRIKLQLVMPGLQNRLRLVVNDGDTEESGQPAMDDSKDNDIAFRWVTSVGDDVALSYDLGIRIQGGRVDEFARVNAGITYPVVGEWQGQTTNRLYYYASAGWRNDFAQRFDRSYGDDLLFRSRSRIQYFQNHSYNPTLEQKFSLFQSLDAQSVLAYEVLWRRRSEEESVYGDSDLLIDPQDHYDQFAVQLRYRRSIGRPWFFVEFWPIVYWPEERDWQTSLAARIRVEVNLGSMGKLKLDD
jgi:hypothetical protein